MKKQKLSYYQYNLLNDDTSNRANVINDINAYYRMLIKALDRAANVNIYKSISFFFNNGGMKS